MGWEPQVHTRVTAWDDEGRPVAWVTRSEPEWDDIERDIMLARRRIDDTRCGGCGGDLEQTLTDLPPDEDAYDFGFRVTPVWCRQCVAHARWSHGQEKRDEELRGTVADEYPEVRRITSQRIELPKN